MNTQFSKFLSLILRHKPETIGLELDKEGWANTSELLEKVKLNGKAISLEQLTEVVETNDKKRFIFSEDKSRIRANQGHSLKVDLGLKATTPPEILYHGTAIRNVDSIRAKGLIKGDRQYVHLSSEQETAKRVGMRYGKPVLLTINTRPMLKAGYVFYISENGVWLTDVVPVEFIAFPDL